MTMGVLSACATQPVQESVSVIAPPAPAIDATNGAEPLSAQALAWQNRQTQLKMLLQWGLSGRFSATGMPLSANLQWTQAGEQFLVRLSGPLGLGAVQLVGTPSQVVVSANGQQYYTQEPEAFLQHSYNIRLPITALRYWAVGVPQPVSDTPLVDTIAAAMLVSDLQLDSVGRVTHFVQNGWQVSYEEYQDESTLAMPRRILLVQMASPVATEAAAALPTKVKLLIEQWTLPPTAPEVRL